MGKLAVVRVRGEPRSRGSVRDTLRMLGLTRVNHCVLVDDAPPVLGMLQETKDYITWGEARPELVEHLLRRRGRLAGNRRLTEEVVRASGFSSLGEFAEALCAGKADISSIPGLKRVFRLSPPRGGYRSTKRPFRDLGDLGYRGKAINELVLKMV